jgi:lipoprotein NlpI
MSIKDTDANVIQRIGTYFRQRHEYDRACDVLERVLEIRKKQFLSKK